MRKPFEPVNTEFFLENPEDLIKKVSQLRSLEEMRGSMGDNFTRDFLTKIFGAETCMKLLPPIHIIGPEAESNDDSKKTGVCSEAGGN